MKLNKTFSRALVLASIVAISIQPISAVVIDFTGGNVVRLSGPNQTTNNTNLWDDVDYYEQAGFRVDVVSILGGQVGDHFGEGDDVIFTDFFNATTLVVSKMDGTTFDLNHFILVDNYSFSLDENDQPVWGGETFIKANGGANDGYSQLLPVEEFGLPGQQIILGSQFEGITSFEIYSPRFLTQYFSMDDLYIDELPSNSPVPDSGSTLVLLGLALVGLAGLRRRRA